ncbi:MAG: CvpA family protein [Ruminococcus sp.]|nr:CvpA family protein [Ruminococcus sp.]
MLYDIILIGIVLLSVFAGIKNGAAKTLLSLLAIVGAGVLAVVISKPLADFIFESFMRDSLETDISAAIESYRSGGAGDFENPLATIFLGAMAYFGNSKESMDASCSELISQQGEDAAPSIVNLYKPVITGVVSVILTVILFILLFIVLRFIAKLAAKVFRLPLVRFADSLAGGALGLLRGVAVIVALALLLNLLSPMLGGQVSFLSSDSINKSSVFSFIYNGGLTKTIQEFIYSIS